MSVFVQNSIQSASPYAGQPVENWLDITRNLLASHPLSVEQIVDAVHVAWNGVWSTQIGSGAARLWLYEVDPPATVIGYFFEKLLGKELATRYPNEWAGGSSGDHKDLHYINDKRFSIEVKTSGQLGLKIFGNRSYGQEVENSDRAKKDKSGYFITLNFHARQINMIRFGWIDGSDWVAQKSATGQMAGLPPEVYQYKLFAIGGDYTLNAPVQLLSGIGPGIAVQCTALGINTIRDALNNPHLLTGNLAKVHLAAVTYKINWAS